VESHNVFVNPLPLFNTFLSIFHFFSITNFFVIRLTSKIARIRRIHRNSIINTFAHTHNKTCKSNHNNNIHKICLRVQDKLTQTRQIDTHAHHKDFFVPVSRLLEEGICRSVGVHVVPTRRRRRCRCRCVLSHVEAVHVFRVRGQLVQTLDGRVYSLVCSSFHPSLSTLLLLLVVLVLVVIARFL